MQTPMSVRSMDLSSSGHQVAVSKAHDLISRTQARMWPTPAMWPRPPPADAVRARSHGSGPTPPPARDGDVAKAAASRRRRSEPAAAGRRRRRHIDARLRASSRPASAPRPGPPPRLVPARLRAPQLPSSWTLTHPLFPCPRCHAAVPVQQRRPPAQPAGPSVLPGPGRLPAGSGCALRPGPGRLRVRAAAAEAATTKAGPGRPGPGRLRVRAAAAEAATTKAGPGRPGRSRLRVRRRCDGGRGSEQRRRRQLS
jgi:hypothetical protein